MSDREDMVLWLEDAARYFEARDTHGEDQAHWANVFNAKMCRKIKDNLAARTGPDVAVKPLRWDKNPDYDEWYSYDEGHYQVPDYVVSRSPVSAPVWRMRVRGFLLEEDFDTPDDAKAAAQADFEQRIRSAIVGTAEPGYVAVPRVPTDAMLEAGEETFVCGMKGTPVSTPLDVWTAMVDAALPAPATASTGEEVTVEEFGLALRLVMPNTLPDDFFDRGSPTRKRIANDIARRLKVEFAITRKSEERS